MLFLWSWPGPPMTTIALTTMPSPPPHPTPTYFLTPALLKNPHIRSEPGPRAPCHPVNHRHLNGAIRAARKSVRADLVCNISLLPAYVGAPINVALAVLYSATSAPALVTEPLYIRTQNELRVDVRVPAKGAAEFSKTLATFLRLAFAPLAWALVAFAAGQAAYALAAFTVFLKLLWVVNAKDPYSDQKLLHLSGAMTAQSAVKHFLTEGDKLLISCFSPLADQGGYAIASNYGSRVARVVFQPIEETSRVFFSESLSSSPSSSLFKENDQEVLQTAV
ncbi:Rft protein-domain-containing protein [Lactarius psammicola]|nr:Rft protein-domain-containing protein [Lactarius psammicola]